MEGLSSSESGRYAELATELAQVLDAVRELEAHMGGADKGEACRALVSTMRSSVDRSIHIAMSPCCVLGAPESPPPSADGSPRSDLAADSRCRAAHAAAHSKKRKTQPKWSAQVRVNSVQDVGPLDDGFSWRKYGQKDILGAKYPRAYFRCTHRHTQGCYASKQVQRADGDPLLFDVVYHGNHTCAQGKRPQAAASGEHWPQQPGGVDTAAGLKTDGGVVAPFSFPSKLAGSDFPAGRAITASPLMSPATSECQVSRRNVPDPELTSTTESPVGDMDFILQLADADFLDNSRYL